MWTGSENELQRVINQHISETVAANSGAVQNPRQTLSPAAVTSSSFGAAEQTSPLPLWLQVQAGIPWDGWNDRGHPQGYLAAKTHLTCQQRLSPREWLHRLC